MKRSQYTADEKILDQTGQNLRYEQVFIQG